MDVTTLGCEVEQDRLDPCDRLRLAARHETGPVASPFDATAGPKIHEMNALLLEPLVAPDRITPVGVAAVYENVSLVELRGQIIEDLIDHRPRRDVDEDRSRGSKLRLEICQGAGFDQPGLDHVGRGATAGIAHHAYPLLQSLPGEIPAHPAQAHNAILVVLGFHHWFSSLLFVSLPSAQNVLRNPLSVPPYSYSSV